MFGINTHTPAQSVATDATNDVNATNSAASTARAKQAKATGPSALDSDQTVKVSSTAGALAQIAGQSDVRQEKVAQLQAAIASGSYNVSSNDVADKLIESMLG